MGEKKLKTVSTDLCLKCGKAFIGNQNSIQCLQCEKWIHLKCSKIDKAAFNILTENDDVTWSCEDCMTGKKDNKPWLSTMQLLLDKVLAMEKQLEEQGKVILNQVKALEDKNQKITVLEMEMAVLKQKMENCEDGVFTELRERELKRNNLLIQEMPEAKGNNKEE